MTPLATRTIEDPRTRGQRKKIDETCDLAAVLDEIEQRLVLVKILRIEL